MKNKLEIFIKVAQYLSFTLASKELNLSQPAISKTIIKLEEEYNTTFFNRTRNTISLTNEGKIFLDYAYRIVELYDEMENAFLLEQNDVSLDFNIGLSTTIATYVMPKVIAKIQSNSNETHFNIISSNTKEVESKILSHELDYGIVEGKSSNQLLSYQKFIKDEIVLVTSTQNPFSKSTVSQKELNELPMVSREIGSGTRDIIEDIFEKNGINTRNTIITLNSTEAIIQYLQHSNTYALVSINAAAEQLKQNKLRIIDIKGLSLEREFFFVCRTGYQSKKKDLLFKLIKTNYNL